MRWENNLAMRGCSWVMWVSIEAKLENNAVMMENSVVMLESNAVMLVNNVAR